jgi:thiamine transport system ATP-binding protein
VLSAEQARPVVQAYDDPTHLGRGGQAVALRRSALQVDDTGPLTAHVVSSRSTPEQTRLVVRLDDGLELDAVAPAGRAWAAGDRVRMRLDVTRIATLPTNATPAGP